MKIIHSFILLLALATIQLQAQNTSIEKSKLATLKEFKGDHLGAIKLYNEIIQETPRNDDAYVKRGVLYLQLGNYTNALSDFSKAIRLNPKNASAYCSRAIVYSDLKEFGVEMAIADLNIAIGIDPNNAYAYLMRGFSYANLGKMQEAYWDYATALQIDPAETKSYYHMAVETGIVKNEERTCEFVYSQAMEEDNPVAKSVFLSFCAN